MKKLFLFSAAVCFAAVTKAQTVTTYAGTGEAGYDTDELLLETKFDNPYSVAFDSKGRVFVTDYYNHVIIELSGGEANRRSGEFLQGGYVNTGDGSQPKHAYPMGVVTGENDTIFVVDNGSHTIRRIQIPPSGSLYPVKTIAGGGVSGGAGESGYLDAKGIAARFDLPVDVAISPAKDYLLVADKGNDVIRKIVIKGTDYGKVTTFAGVAGSPGGDDGPVASATFNSPVGLFIDGNGDVYVAEEFGSIRKIAGGTVSTVVEGTFENMFTDVVKVGDALFIADGCVIRRKDLKSGNLTAFAGDETDCDDEDGIATESHFFMIGGMAVSNDQKYLLVGDQMNNRIAKVTINELVSVGETDELSSIDVYPNPAQNRINVSGMSGKTAISLCDITGRVIQQEITNNTNHTMDVSALSNGVYVLRLASGNKTTSERVVISK